MGDKLEDVKLTVRIDVAAAEKDAEKVSKRTEQKRERSRRRQEQKEKDATEHTFPHGIGRKGLRGIEDLARGRVPRFGGKVGGKILGVAATVAGILEAVEIIGGAAGNIPGLGRIGLEAAKRAKEVKHAVTDPLAAYEATKEYAISKKLAGRDTSTSEIGDVFARRLAGQHRLGRLQIQKELLVAPELAPIALKVGSAIIVELLTGIPKAAMKSVLGDSVREIVHDEVRGMSQGGAGRR